MQENATTFVLVVTSHLYKEATPLIQPHAAVLNKKYGRFSIETFSHNHTKQ